MEKKEIISSFSQELRRGTVVLCVLCHLSTPTYGYNLIGMLTGSGIPIEANTLYPLLRRLETQGLLQSSWDTDGAKPRKYYVTTGFGNEVLLELKAQWRTISQNLDNIMGE